MWVCGCWVYGRSLFLCLEGSFPRLEVHENRTKRVVWDKRMILRWERRLVVWDREGALPVPWPRCRFLSPCPPPLPPSMRRLHRCELVALHEIEAFTPALVPRAQQWMFAQDADRLCEVWLHAVLVLVLVLPLVALALGHVLVVTLFSSYSNLGCRQLEHALPISRVDAAPALPLPYMPPWKSCCRRPQSCCLPRRSLTVCRPRC